MHANNVSIKPIKIYI